MRELERRITVLRYDEEMTADARSEWEDGIVAYLRDRPELDGPFLDRYITNPVDDMDRMAGLGILCFLGRQRQFDHKPLMSLIERRGGGSTELRHAAFCVSQLANYLDAGELLRLTEIMPQEERVSAYCKLIDALATMTDRGKAMRVLAHCLRGTDTRDHDEQFFLLTNFVQRVNGNEDIFEAALAEPRPPHETVVMAVALMREQLAGVGTRLRTVVEDAVAKSPLAADYYHFYVGFYIAR